MIKRPMLAATWTEGIHIPFPVIASPKLDGIRCLKINGKAVTRNFKPIPNRYIREKIESYDFPDNVDGEIVLANTTGEFCDVTSAVMSFDGQPDFRYIVFDWFENPHLSFRQRLESLEEISNQIDNKVFWILGQRLIHSMDELLEMETAELEQGYEGLIIRNPYSPYKEGRSTIKEFGMVKIKRFSESDAIIVGFEEKMSNQNAPEKDAFGLQERSSKQENLVPCNTLGALIVKDCHPDSPFLHQGFSVGTGFDDYTRQKIWNEKDAHFGKVINYKYQKRGSKDLPRFPVFLKFKEL